MGIVCTVQDVQQLEREWASDHDGSTWGLMVAASQSFVARFQADFAGRRVLVVAGNGNNGGDGFYIAKLLLEQDVKVSVATPLGLPPDNIDAFRACQEYQAAGGQMDEHLESAEADLLVDALFGVGLNRPLSGKALVTVTRINRLNLPVYAVDIPSGLHAQTGVCQPVAVHACATHTFIAYKPGQLTAAGPALCGELTLDSLGIQSTSSWRYARAFEPCLPARQGATHKAEHGNLHVVGGLKNMAGAAIITATSALNAGAGRVFLHCHELGHAAALARAPELMTRDVQRLLEEPPEGTYVIGPGMGMSSLAMQLWQVLLPKAKGVMDADALRLLAAQPVPVSGWVLTPHESEAAALLGVTSADIKADRLDSAQELASKYQTTVVLKGAGTIVATTEDIRFCYAGAPEMSTPGMGDCLAGIIGSLIAQGLLPEQAAVAGVNWHAHLGAKLARRQRIVLASDIIPLLKQIPDLAD
ncbi:NAD(P)H-hydrate dehydratase [Reinekea marinisedimentorum]|uniref:Bifunctional NAD(P)H-hydrate repair enzyme n=1 Tax=Reinekea marinisedimentorum TaxID=230495 RepID=A0A4V2UJN5_9GAMM|nr:NAD(P)H-hydrate dehydratase [Reinekea marinisedimentorum]TCS40799.1 NAD(P)H-hydrate epimerase [Reinekea marinisedimentorum]